MASAYARLALTLCCAVLLCQPAQAQQTMQEALAMCMADDPTAVITGCSWILDPQHATTLHTNVSAYLRRGVAHDLLGEYELAIDDYSALIKLLPQAARLYRYRGVSQGKLGRHKQAIRDFNRALKIEPDHAETYFNRGYSHSREQDFDDAIADYSKAIELDPEYTEAINNRGHSYALQQQCDKAIADFSAAITLKPDHALAYANRAECQYELGNMQASLADHDRSIELQPDNADLYNSSCWTRAISGDGEGALAHCDEAIRLAPDVPEFYDSRALAHYQMQNYAAAMADENRSMVDPQWENYLLRAAIHYRLGETGKARTDYKSARRLQRKKDILNERLEDLGLSPSALKR